MSNDPGALVQLYTFMRTGQGTMAAGLVLTFLVAAIRHGGFARFAPTKAWAESKTGGYVIGFGTSIATYLSTAFLASQALTMTLALNAIGAGFVAAGGWEHLQDVLGFIRQTPPPTGKAVNTAAVTSLFLSIMLTFGLLTMGLSGCTKNTRVETLQVTKLGLDAAKDGFDAWNAQHEMEIADDPKLTSKEAYTAAITAYRTARKKVIDALTLAYQLYSTATAQNDAPSLSAAVGQAAVLYQGIKTLEGDLKGGK